MLGRYHYLFSLSTAARYWIVLYRLSMPLGMTVSMVIGGTALEGVVMEGGMLAHMVTLLVQRTTGIAQVLTMVVLVVQSMIDTTDHHMIGAEVLIMVVIEGEDRRTLVMGALRFLDVQP